MKVVFLISWRAEENWFGFGLYCYWRTYSVEVLIGCY